MANNRLPGGRVVCRFSTSCPAASDKSTQRSHPHAGTEFLALFLVFIQSTMCCHSWNCCITNRNTWKWSLRFC